MITDPKTTVRTKWGQCAVAFAVALAEAILRLDRVVHAPYYALFLVGPAANADLVESRHRRSFSQDWKRAIDHMLAGVERLVDLAGTT